MQEKTCNLWLEPAEYRCIPTTGAITPSGEACMDSGVALEAKQRFAGIESDLGRLIASRGNHVHLIRPGIISFPIQQFAFAGPSLQVIARSAQELRELVGNAITLLPRPGTEAGGLDWERVSEALRLLPDNVIVIQHR